MHSLERFSALVTGASSGIGRATAEMLAGAGARVLCVARREHRLEELTAALPGSPGRGHDFVVADLGEEPAIDTVMERAQGWGPIDILVNNAGVSVPAPPGSPTEVWDEAFRLQFHAPRRLAEAVLPGMSSRGFGRIVNVGGTSEPGDVPNASTAAKAALCVWAKAVANASAAFGVTVNTVVPGRVESEQLTSVLHPDPAERAEFARTRIPARRFGAAADVGQLILFLAGRPAEYITGAVIPVDGGFRRFAF